MNILMIDNLSIYVQGLEIGLKEIIPDITVKSTANREDVLCILAESDVSIILLDGETNCSIELMDELATYYPTIPIIVMLREIKKSVLRTYLKHHALAIISKSSTLEIICQVLMAVSAGIVCLPDSSVIVEDDDHSSRPIEKLSRRQREILELIAAGQSNKQISRHLDISTGTVKAHLESIYRRLNVHNRTQAAMMLNWESYN